MKITHITEEQRNFLPRAKDPKDYCRASKDGCVCTRDKNHRHLYHAAHFDDYYEPLKYNTIQIARWFNFGWWK